MSPTQRSSLCLLGALPGCGTSAFVASSPPAVNAADPSSSWVNATNLSVPTPPSRYLPSMVFSPADHGDLLFGGYGPEAVAPYAYVFYQDTWLLSGTTWSELVANTSCTPSTCPSPRAGAMMASLGTAGVLLYGGYDYVITFGGPAPRAHADTWLFSHGHWVNITATAGTAPPARFDGSMAYDSQDNLVLLFGGEQVSGTTLGDTWEFAGGTWTNVTATAGSYTLNTAPEPRAGAAIGASPDGHIMLYGGEDQGIIISNYCGNGSYSVPGLSAIAWWFYQGHWLPETNYGVSTCPPHILQQASAAPSASVSPATSTTDPPSVGPPCGREFAALGWSKNNNRFVLYGGYGYTGTPVSSALGVCSGAEAYLNDTLLYAEPPGGGFDWLNVTDAGDPPARQWTGYAGDLSSGYFVIFGGEGMSGPLRETWRFFELVHARFSGPSTIDTSGALSFQVPFVVTGYGGSSNLTYAFAYQGLRTTNTLSATGDCSIITSGQPYTVPYDGVVSFVCQPTPQSYNVYRATVHVVDITNTSDSAYANWTFTVKPPQAIHIYSRYVTYFYTGLDFKNNYTVFAEVLNAGATTLTATLGTTPITFTQRASDPRYWESGPIEMSGVTPGSVLAVSADFGHWTLNATYNVQMISTPDWLQQIITNAGGGITITSKGSHPWNWTYSATWTDTWNLQQICNFGLSVPLITGNWSVIPSASVSFGWDSTGNVSLAGTFALATPKISLGPAALTLSASIGLKGTFALEHTGPDIQGIQWLSAQATITITGDFSANIPIYGFSFSLLGQTVSIGFTLYLDLKPSIALSMLLAPTTDASKDLITDIPIMMTQLLGTFTIPLTAAVQFSLLIASVQFGGTLAVTLAFNITPSFAVAGGEVTGAIFVGASFLFWSATWNMVGPGVIYGWGTYSTAHLAQRATGSAYDNGSDAVWTLSNRYYNTAGYDANAWNGSAASGTAISNIYPSADPVAAAASNGAYLFYTDDNVGLPVNQGLTLSGRWLDADTNQLVSIPAPSDPGFIMARPQATTLSDGSLYVIWDALPMSQATVAGPQDVSVIALHGALYDPWNRTWGPVRAFTTTGIADSYQVDPTGASGRIVALLTDGVAVGQTTPERLVQFDAATGAQLSSANVSGIADVVSSRGGSGWAVVRDFGGHYTVAHLSDGTPVALSYTPPSASSLISERFESGSSSTLLLLYRLNLTSQAVLYDLASGTTVASLALPGNATDVEAIASGPTSYVFASTPAGIEGWTESGGAWSNYTFVELTGVRQFGVVQSGSSLLLFAITRSGGTDSAPLKSLVLAEVAAALPALPAPPPTPSSTPSAGSPDYALYLGLVAAADVAVFAVLVIWKRRRSPPTTDVAEEPGSSVEPHDEPPGGR